MRRHAPAEIERGERASIVGVGRTSRPLHTSSGHVDGSDLVAAFVWSQSSSTVGDLPATRGQDLEPDVGSCSAGSNGKRRAHPAARS
jgi:hypothetical protein